MTRLFIAEKPSLGLAVAQGLGIEKKERGFIRCKGGDIVTWAIGHLIEQYTPDDYDPALKPWENETLPITPDPWKMKISVKTKDQFNVVKRLIKDATVLVNTGDPDRAGQIICDEIIEYCNAKQPVKRLLISDLNSGPVKKAISKIQDNAITVKMGHAAKAQSRADWLLGMNLTRACTIAGREAGYDGVLSIGRVQTPLLGLIVRRDLDIENFTAKPFYGINGKFGCKQGELNAKWQVIAPASSIDDSGRLIDKDIAENAIKAMHGKSALVKSVESKTVKSRPPLLFSLSELQKTANKSLGLTAQQTLDVAQSLYEKHKVTTYPRSDCRYLPVEQMGFAEQNCKTIMEGIPEFKGFSSQLSYNQKTPAFNDSKVGAHHAIVPTGKLPGSDLGAHEKQIYEIICRQYFAQFLGDKITDKTEIIIDLGSESLRFKTSGSILKAAGFSVLFKEQEDKLLPNVSEGEQLTINDLSIIDKMTSPPARFTEATLLDAMTGIAKFLKDKNKASALKETDGLGTEATRASIIEILVKRNFVLRDKKNFVSVPLGRDLIKALPDVLTWPDMTAIWESQLNEISEGNIQVSSFLKDIVGRVGELVAGVQSQKMDMNVDVHPCPKCSLKLNRIKTKDKGHFWACSGYRETGCDYKTDDKKGQPDLSEKVIYDCPECSKPLAKRNGANGMFWSCTGYRDGCKYSCDNKRNKPDFESKKAKQSGAEKEEIADCPKCSKTIKRLYSTKQTSYFWMHKEDQGDCSKFVKDDNGVPVASNPGSNNSGAKEETADCPKCSKIIKRLYSTKQTSHFWMHKGEQGDCSKYIKDKEGQPVS